MKQGKKREENSGEQAQAYPVCTIAQNLRSPFYLKWRDKRLETICIGTAIVCTATVQQPSGYVALGPVRTIVTLRVEVVVITFAPFHLPS